jgi:hypothetical protein
MMVIGGISIAMNIYANADSKFEGRGSGLVSLSR